jgi:hypothetical protein
VFTPLHRDLLSLASEGINKSDDFPYILFMGAYGLTIANVDTGKDEKREDYETTNINAAKISALRHIMKQEEGI